MIVSEVGVFEGGVREGPDREMVLEVICSVVGELNVSVTVGRS